MYKVKVNEILQHENTEGGKGVLKDSGIYKIKIIRAEISANTYGAKSIRLRIQPEDGYAESYLFGPRLDQNNKQPHFEAILFDSLLVCCDKMEIKNPVKKKITYKNGKTEEVMVFEDLTNKEVYVRVATEVSRYQDQIKERLLIKNFFRAKDKLSAAEILNKVAEPNRFELESKIAELHIFRDNTTQEDLDNLRKEKLAAANATTPEAQNNNKAIEDSFSFSDEDIPF